MLILAVKTVYAEFAAVKKKKGFLLISDPRKHPIGLERLKMTCQELKLNHDFLLLQSVIQTHMLRAPKLPVAIAKNQSH